MIGSGLTNSLTHCILYTIFVLIDITLLGTISTFGLVIITKSFSAINCLLFVSMNSQCEFDVKLFPYPN